MKLLHSSLAAILGFTLIAGNANADILCQRKKEKKPSPVGSVLNLKLVKGSTCPAGFIKVADYITSADVQGLINQGVANISSLGEPGATGPQGPVGATGVQGAVGLQGATGPQGFQGETGNQGRPGEQGPQGEVGLQGATGPQGEVGLQGATGPQGEVGLQGATGAQGEVGLQGPTGPQGVQGDTGASGVQGATGVAGILAIDSCYTTTGSRTGSFDETQTFYCNNPANEFVFHVGYSVDKDTAGPVRESLEFSKNSVSYTHPVGATVRAYNGTLIGNSYTLSVTLLCCPINVDNLQ